MVYLISPLQNESLGWFFFGRGELFSSLQATTSTWKDHDIFVIRNLNHPFVNTKVTYFIVLVKHFRALVTS